MITLNLSNNQIGFEGIQKLADALVHNKVLFSLISIRYICSLILYRFLLH